MAAGSGSTHASRKSEGLHKLSARTVTKKIPDPFVFPGCMQLLGMNPQHVAHAKCTYIQPDSEYGMCHKALQPGLRWFGRS